MLTALITGITGQDGSYLAELLLSKGYRVVGMARRASTVTYERIQHLLVIGSRQEIAQLSRQVNTQQHELVRDRDVLARQREALALLNSPNAKKMELTAGQTAQNARGTFVYDQKTGRAILMAEGLPATPADKAYELWFIPKGHSPMAGRMFTIDASGHAMLPEQMPAEAMENAVIAITLEPKKGSAVPTGAIYLSSPSS